MSSVEKKEEEISYIFCQSCLKSVPLTSESKILHYNFHTDLYIGFCLDVSCKKKILSRLMVYT